MNERTFVNIKKELLSFSREVIMPSDELGLDILMV
jgi:hypothetical protein